MIQSKPILGCFLSFVAISSFALSPSLAGSPPKDRDVSRLDSAQGGLGAPPDGVYDCHKLSGSSLIGFGNLTIKGKTYRGMGDEGKFSPYTVDGSNVITWSAGLDGMPDGWKILWSKYIGHKQIVIHYISASGTEDSIDATQN